MTAGIPLFHLPPSAPGAGRTYWLTRFVILRLLGIIYAVAFLVAVNQIVPLIGNDGLLPAERYLENISKSIGPIDGFVHYPSVFWFGHSDAALLTVAWTGFILSWRPVRRALSNSHPPVWRS